MGDNYNASLIIIVVLCGVVYFVMQAPKKYMTFLDAFFNRGTTDLLSELAFISLEQTIPGKPINIEYIRGFETNTSNTNVISASSKIQPNPKDRRRKDADMLSDGLNWAGRVHYGWRIKLVNEEYNYKLRLTNNKFSHDTNRYSVYGVDDGSDDSDYFEIKGPTYDLNRTGVVQDLDIVQLQKVGTSHFLGAHHQSTPYERDYSAGTDTTAPLAAGFAEVFGYGTNTETSTTDYTNWRVYVNFSGTISLQHVLTYRESSDEMKDEKYFLHGSDSYLYRNCDKDNCEQKESEKIKVNSQYIHVISCYHEKRKDARQNWLVYGSNGITASFTPKNVTSETKEKIKIHLRSGGNRGHQGEFKLERLQIKNSTNESSQNSGLLVKLLSRDSQVLKVWPAFVESVPVYTLYRRSPKIRLEQTNKDTPIKLLQIKAFTASGDNIISKKNAMIIARADRAKTVKSTNKALSNILTNDSKAGWTMSGKNKKEWVEIHLHTLETIGRIEIIQDPPNSLAGLVVKLWSHDESLLKEWDPLISQTHNYSLPVT